MNNLMPSKTGSIVTFRGFDKEIEQYLEPKIPLSHKLINQVDIPLIVDSLREYLIRNAGCFTISGFYRPNDLSIWYDREAILEEFDDLLLKFKDWIFTLGVDINEQYTLIRVRDNLTFVMVNVVVEQEPVLDLFEKHNQHLEYAAGRVEGFLEEVTERLFSKVHEIEDAEAFMKELISPERIREVLQRHMVPIEE